MRAAQFVHPAFHPKSRSTGQRLHYWGKNPVAFAAGVGYFLSIHLTSK
jgi:hypothetical protein